MWEPLNIVGKVLENIDGSGGVYELLPSENIAKREGLIAREPRDRSICAACR